MKTTILCLSIGKLCFSGGNENTKVGVAGDSAGGLIAASVCHTVKNLDFQVLILSKEIN